MVLKSFLDYIKYQIQSFKQRTMKSDLIAQNKSSGMTNSSQFSLVDSVFYENSDHENVIVIGNDSNANFRTYYMALLKGIQ